MVLGLVMRHVLITSVLAGVVGLAACDPGPAAPTSLTVPASPQPRIPTAAETPDETQLQALTDRAAQLQSPTVDREILPNVVYDP